MVEEYDEEATVAAAKIKLEENVQQLIREEIKKAFMDGSFMASIVGQLRKDIFIGAEWDYTFQQTLKNFMNNQMNKG